MNLRSYGGNKDIHTYIHTLFRQTTVLMKLLFPFSFNVDPKHNFRVKHIESHMQTSYSKYLLSHKIHGLD